MNWPRRAAGGEHWSKDFVEHLRTVHFALVTVSVGLILLLTSKDYDPKAAARQLKQVEGIAGNLNTLDQRPKLTWELIELNPTTSDQIEVENSNAFIARQIKVEQIKVEGLKVTELPLQNSNEKIAFKLRKPNLYFCDHKTWLYSDLASISNLHTLSDFAVAWNRFPFFLDSITALYRQRGERRYFSDSPFVIAHMLITQPLSGEATIDNAVDLELQSYSDCNLKGHPKKSLEVESRVLGDGKGLYRFPVSQLTRFTIEQNDFYRQKLSFMTFDQAFPDLAVASDHAGDDSFSAMEAQLAKENEKEEAFEAFGIRFPTEQVTKWGIVLLLGVQSYLVMYLKQLWKKLKYDDPGWDMPWMAMDQSLLARLMLFVSIVLIPAAAALFILVKSEIRYSSGTALWHVLSVFRSLPMSGRFAYVLILLGCVSSLVLSVLCWKYRPRLEEPPVPNQLFE